MLGRTSCFRWHFLGDSGGPAAKRAGRSGSSGSLCPPRHSPASGNTLALAPASPKGTWAQQAAKRDVWGRLRERGTGQ